MARASEPQRSVVAGVLAFVFGAVASVSLVAYGGRWVWQLDLLTHFRLQYVAVLALGAAVLILTKRKWATVFVVAVLAVNALAVAPLYLPAPDRDTSHGPVLRVLSFNMKGFETEPVPVLEFLRSTDADIVFLHEANVEWEEPLRAEDIPFQLDFPRREGSIFGTAVLTRSADGVRGIVLGPEQRVSVEVTLTHDGRQVKLLGIHAYAPVSQFYSDRRNEQFADVERWALEANAPAVVVGDFNATPWSHAFPTSGMVDAGRGHGFHGSWPVGWEPFSIPIDNAVMTDEWMTVRRWLGPDLGSDHYPLFFDLALEER